MRRPVVWVTEHVHEDALQRLAESAEVLGPGEISADQRERVNGVVVRSTVVDRAFMDTLPALRAIGKHGAGTDTIDVELARQRGIHVDRAAGANAESVADLAVCLALLLLRAPDHHDAALRQGRRVPVEQRTGHELGERHCGIAGLGAIGSAVRRRIEAFGPDITAFDPGVADEDWPSGVARASDMDALLSACDLVFLHLPLLPATRHSIDAAALARMPAGSMIVNCARGGIVVEQDLADALASGHIAGAASDVFEHEPPSPDNPLFAEGLRFIGLPHQGAATHEGLRRTGLMIADKLLAALDQPTDH